MKRFFIESEYALPAEEFTSPPEQPETLQDRRRYPGAPGTPPEPKADSGDPVNPTISEAAEEAAAAAKASEVGQTAARQARKKRSLLLQIAAVASSVVLVSNSFGLDFLGLDGLFNDSVIIGQVEAETKPARPADELPGYAIGGDFEEPFQDRPEQPREDAFITAGRFNSQLNDLTLTFTVEGYAYAGDWWKREYDVGASQFIPPEKGISYDAGSNTLTLSDYHGTGLDIFKMGTDFTIRLEGRNTLKQSIRASTTVLHFTGTGTLSVNTERTLEYGIQLEPYDSRDGYIVVGKDVNMDVYGSSSAIQVESTGAEKMLYYLSDREIEGIRQIPSASIDAEGRTTWSLVDPETFRTAGYICFGEGPGEPEMGNGLPVGGDSAFTVSGSPDPQFPEILMLPHSRYIAAIDFAQVSEKTLNGTVSGFAYLDPEFSGSELSIYPLSRLDVPAEAYSVLSDPSIRYDEAANTLTLTNYHGKGLLICQMGNDFTIRVEGDCELEEGIVVSFGSLTLCGSGFLKVNSHFETDHGILLHGGFSEAALFIRDDVGFDIEGNGKSAVAARLTCAEKMVWYESSQAVPSLLQVPLLDEETSPFPDTDTRVYRSWSLISEIDNTAVGGWSRGSGSGPAPDTPTEPVIEPVTEPVTEAPTEPVQETGLPIGGDSAFPILGDPLPTSPRITAYFDRTETGPSRWNSHLTILGDEDYNDPEEYGISYDRTTNTLTLKNFYGGSLVISGMGNSFKLCLEGKNELSHRLFVEQQSLTITGYGYLAVNTSGSDTFGIQMDLSFGKTCLMIDAGVSLVVHGEACAISVRDTSAEKGIYYLSSYPLFGVRQEISQDPGETNSEFVAWRTVDDEGNPVRDIHIGGEAPPVPEYPALPVGGDAEFPVLPNLEPNTPVPGYGVLNEDYIQIFDRDTDTWEFLYLNPAWNNELVSPEGISYDRATNTLTLNNYYGGGISANLLGNGFTVELIGENELTQDFMVWGFYTGGSITFTGTGSLTINRSYSQPIGLSLYCEGSESCIMIDSTVTLDIYGAMNAVGVYDTSAEKAIVYLSEKTVPGVLQHMALEKTVDGVVYRQWILIKNQGGWNVKTFHIEGVKTEP